MSWRGCPGNRFTTRPQRRNGKVKRSQTFFPYSLIPRPSFPSLVIPRVVFIRVLCRMTVPSPALQSCDNDSFEQGALSPLPARESKTNRRDFTAVKPRDDSVFHDFQYIARLVIPGSTPYRFLIEERNKNHLDRVCWATSLLYDATIPISRHKVVFFRGAANSEIATV